MRGTVGKRDETKVLRKVVRHSAARALAAAAGGGGGASEAALVSLLGGAGGASAHMVTLAPTHRRKLPYTFSTALREQRLAAGLEDDTDDEAVEAGAVNEKGEPLRGEPVPTGAASLSAQGAAAAAAAAGGAAGGEDGMAEGGEAEELRRLLGGGAPQLSGRKMAGNKPVGKRDMSASYYDWQNKDLVQPAVPGFFYEELPKGKGKLKRDARGGKYKHVKKGGGIFPVAR
jgi:hypothetical protein